jgi:hypothetical protein
MDYRNDFAATVSRLSAAERRIAELEAELAALRLDRTAELGEALPAQLVSGMNGDVRALRRRDGTLLWERSLGHGPIVVVHHVDAVYAGCGGHLYRLDPTSGEVVWRNPLRGLGYALPVLVVAALGFAPTDAIFAGLGGSIVALESAAGKLIWQRELPGTTLAAEVNFVLFGRRIYAVSGGATSCLDAGTGEIVWQNREAGAGMQVTCLASHDLGAFLQLSAQTRR